MSDRRDELAREGVEHLQAAAREVIKATRSLLDAAEELVDDPAAVQHLVGSIATVAQAAAGRLRRVADRVMDLERMDAHLEVDLAGELEVAVVVAVSAEHQVDVPTRLDARRHHQLEFRRAIGSPNGEDVMYVFYEHEGGRSIAIPLPHPSGASSWIHGPGHQAILADTDAVMACSRIHDRCGTNLVVLLAVASVAMAAVPGVLQLPLFWKALGNTLYFVALEAGAKALLIDEDTAATNLMIRDARMQELVAKDREPLTPLVDLVRSMAAPLAITSFGWAVVPDVKNPMQRSSQRVRTGSNPSRVACEPMPVISSSEDVRSRSVTRKRSRSSRRHPTPVRSRRPPGPTRGSRR